jgi:hypothetical protein
MKYRINITDNQPTGQPYTLPHRTPRGWIGRNATEAELRERGIVPCDVLTTADPEAAGAVYDAAEGRATFTRYVEPPPTLEQRLEPHMQAIGMFLAAWQATGIGALPASWPEAIAAIKGAGLTADVALELDILWRQLLPVEADLRAWLAKQGEGE